MKIYFPKIAVGSFKPSNPFTLKAFPVNILLPWLKKPVPLFKRRFTFRSPITKA